MTALANPRHEIFARQVAAGLPQGEAYILAGFSAKTAAVGASRLVKKSEVSARICELSAEIGQVVKMDAAYLLVHLGDMLTADIADIIEKENVPAVPATASTKEIPARQRGNYKPIHEWPKIWRQMLTGCDIENVVQRSTDGVQAGDSKSWDIIGRVTKIRFLDRLRTAELFGRHKVVDAFVQQQRGPELHLHLHEEIEGRLLRAREVAATHVVSLPAR